MSLSFEEDPEFNPYAPPKGELIFDDLAPVSEFAGYAGFWRRLLAYLIDYIVTYIMATTVSVIIQMALMATVEFRGDRLNYVVITGYVIGMIVSMAIHVGYWAAMESSAAQATLGKMALGIKVTDLYGRRITFGRALGRTCAKFLSGMTLMIGYVMAGFTDRRQALHDLIASTLVIRAR